MRGGAPRAARGPRAEGPCAPRWPGAHPARPLWIEAPTAKCWASPEEEEEEEEEEGGSHPGLILCWGLGKSSGPLRSWSPAPPSA